MLKGSASPLDAPGGTDSIAPATATIQLQISPVPEPSAVAALCGLAGTGGLIWVVWWRRRRPAPSLPADEGYLEESSVHKTLLLRVTRLFVINGKAYAKAAKRSNLYQR